MIALPLQLRWMLSLALAAGVASAACDEVRVDQSPSRGPAASEFQSRSIRARLTERGIASLFETSQRESLKVERTSTADRVDGTQISIGPLSEQVSLESVDASVNGNQLELVLTTGATSVTIPVRVEQRVGTRICRFRLDASMWRVETLVQDRSGGDWSLELVGTPSFDTTRLRVRPVGTCPELLDNGSVPSKLSQLLTDYLERAAATGLETFVDVSVHETLGLLRGRVALRRISSYPNRRGSIDLAGTLPDEEGTALDDTGLSTALDVAVSPRRASCSPPDNLPPPEDRPARTIPSADLEDSGAEVGLAIAGPLFARLAQSAALGGFLCRGLDRDRAGGGGSEAIPTEQANLGNVGLDRAPLRGPFEPMIAPGSPPDLELLPGDDSVEMSWTNLTLDLYGSREGARLKLLSLTTEATFTLRPVDPSGPAIPLKIRAISVADARVDSPWNTDLPEDESLERWARRLLLLTFEDLFRVPLPLLPDSSLRSSGAQVRERDLLIFLGFRPD